MRNVRNLDKTPHELEQTFEAAAKLKCQLSANIETEIVPLMKPSSLDIHVKTQDASQNIDLFTKEFFGIDKTLQPIQGELDIYEHIKKITKN